MTFSNDASILLDSLIGPHLSAIAVSGLGGVYARYEADFSRYADSHWASSGSNWANTNYYDRAMIYYEQ